MVVWVVSMLKKQNRLKKKKEFDKVFKAGRPLFWNNLSLRAKNRNDQKDSRFGFIISNKIDKRSTRRNALKRQLREIVRSLISELETGYDVVVIVKQNFSYPYDQTEIESNLVELLRRAKLLKN